jgi:class 3 adenylate cyclase
LGIGIGIATGEVTAGIFGSRKKKEYTVFGVPVNLAAHLEESAGRGQILVCAETYKVAKDYVIGEKTSLSLFRKVAMVVESYRIDGLKEAC